MIVKARENVNEKARRLITEGRLTVTLAGTGMNNEVIRATCRGDSGEVYDLGFYPEEGKWLCTCEARTACSHLRALWLVAVKRKS